MAQCNCDGILNIGAECFNSVEYAQMILVQDLVADDGTRNSLPAVGLQTALQEGILSLDPSKRITPVGYFVNVQYTPAEKVTETTAEGGVRTQRNTSFYSFEGQINDVPTLVIKDMDNYANCGGKGYYVVDFINGAINGATGIVATDLYPRAIETSSWAVRPNSKNGAEAKYAMVRFQENVSQGLFNYAEMSVSADILSVIPNPNIETVVIVGSAPTTTGVTITATRKYAKTILKKSVPTDWFVDGVAGGISGIAVVGDTLVLTFTTPRTSGDTVDLQINTLKYFSESITVTIP